MSITEHTAHDPSYVDEPPEEERRPWTILALALVAQVLVVLDISVVNTALPTIGRSLRLDGGQLQWLVTAYLMMSGGGLLLGGGLVPGGVVLTLDGAPLVYNRKDSLLNPDFIALGDPQLPWKDWLHD
mgnify:CR=1 FL=1